VRTPSRFLVGIIALLGMSLTAQPAAAAFKQYSFSEYVDGTLDPAFATIKLYDGADATALGGTAGNLVVVLSVNTPTYTGDLFALYMNAKNSLVGTLSASVISPANVQIQSPLTQSIDNVNETSNPATLNPIDPVFDVGIQFGVQGGAGGSITTVTFQLNSSAESLEIGDVDLLSELDTHTDEQLRFGLRVQSTGSVNGGSLKLYIPGDQDPDVPDDVDPVPAPAGLVLLATAIPVLGLRRVLRRKTA